jgi:RNA polymerase sigma factor (sigma-70 family)
MGFGKGNMTKNIIRFLETNYEELLAFAVQLNGNWADGEDVLQTVAAKLCKQQNELTDLTYAKTYLMVCIRNATLNLNRTKARQHMADVDLERIAEAVPDPDVEQEFRYVEWAESLEKHLKRYDEPLRKAFIAYYVDQEKLETVAGSLGLTARQLTKKFANMRAYLKRNHRHLFIELSILLTM